MKSLFGATVLVLLAQTSFAAQKINCDIKIVVDSADPIVQQQVLEKQDGPHGAVGVFELTQFGGITGMLGLMNGDTMVISLADKKGYASSSQATIANGAVAHHQLILPSPGVGMNAIVVDCQYAQ